MSDIIWGYALFSAGIAGLVFPLLLRHLKDRVRLEPRYRWAYMAVENRFERRLGFSVVLAAVGLVWILSETL